jgi:hypothetical protein
LIQVKFGPAKETFGFKSFKSFIEHVDYYQHVQHLQFGNGVVKFEFVNNGIPIYDIFEFFNNVPKDFRFREVFDFDDYEEKNFQDINVIVVETLNQFTTIVNKLDSSKKYIIFSESYWDAEDQFVDLDYELIYMPWDLIDCQNRLANRSNLYFHLIDLDMLSKYKPKYDFLCLAGRSKLWRDKFINKLQTELDLENSLTSYYGKCLGNSDLLKLDIPYKRSDSKVEFEEKFYQPLNVPGTDYKYNLSYFTKNELFYSTKFSVVVETEALLKEYHITEKTIKCLILGHPFVVMGTPGYLKFLHDLGFTTYSDIFDESYDSIQDLESRMDAVINVIQKLQTQVFDINKLRNIQNKNLNAFIKLRHIDIYKKFLGLFDV